MAKTKSDKKDPRTIKVTRGDETHMVTPEVARALLGQHDGWSTPDLQDEVAAATGPLEARILELEEQVITLQAELATRPPAAKPATTKPAAGTKES